MLAAYLTATRGSDAKRARLRQRLSEALLHSAHTDDVEVILARQELMSEIPWINRVLVELQVATRMKRVLDQADLHITVTRLIMFSVMAGMLAALAASVLTISILIMVVAGLVGGVAPFYSRLLEKKEAFRAVP